VCFELCSFAFSTVLLTRLYAGCSQVGMSLTPGRTPSTMVLPPAALAMMDEQACYVLGVDKVPGRGARQTCPVPQMNLLIAREGYWQGEHRGTVEWR
jgi:hypothetical protein